MEQAATPGGLGLPCSPKQALALYQHLFRCPADLGQLQAALQQVQESWACPLGLELPAVLLEMERNRRAQEQLLWDLELLAGAGLGLLWPPRARFHRLRDQAQCAWSQHGKPQGRRGKRPEQLTNWNVWEGLEQDRVPDIGLSLSGCLRELNPTTSSSFGDRGSSELESLAQRGERRPAGPTTQRPCGLPSTKACRRKLTQGAPRLPGLPSQGLPKPQVPLEGLGWSLDPERAELQKLLGIEIPLRQREGDPQEQKESPQGQKGGAPQGENKEVPERPKEKTQQGQSGEAPGALREEVSEYPRCEDSQSERTESPQGQRGNGPQCQREKALQESSVGTAPQGPEVKTLRTSPAPNWEVAEGEVPTQPPEEGGALGTYRDFCGSLGEQMPKPRSRESPGSGERTSQRRESALGAGEQSAAGERVRTPLPPPWPPTPPLLPSPGAETPSAPSTGGSGQQERPAAPPEPPGLLRDPHGLQEPEASPGSAEPMLDAVGEPRGNAEDREQRRLRVLECLRIATNRHCRVHPLGPPPNPAQLPPQEDAAGRRQALRQQLQQVHQERTWRLRALGARNTQNFQQLLWPPRSEVPLPGEESSPFPAPSSHC
ncbi:MICAL-like protein 1 [Suricata suricatta]|uniref:MICAL-like protein 1 n=1 Tax=Suricata suricatta TaxID=37032 RepID=UPI0011559D61|nr:MICAL-like protein 1 [Suricata suricatta]